MTDRKRRTAVVLTLVFTIIATGQAVGVTADVGEQPNIIVLLADDLGYGELFLPSDQRIPTPAIDSIAAAGVRFTSAYATGPNCSPSRAGLMTGRIPPRFGYEFNPIGARNEDPAIGLPVSQKTLANVLHDAGYTTGLIGKWHLGGTAAYHPQRRGFDEFFGFMHEGHYFVPPPWDGVTTMLRRRTLPGNQQGRWIGDRLIYSTHMGHDEPPYDADNPMLRAGQPIVEPEYLTDALAREAVDFIHRHHDKPFFLYVAFNAVHSPLQAKDVDMQRFASIEDPHRRIFAGMLASLDDGVGRILGQLRESGIEDDTLVIFLSDNGGPTRELTSSNLPLRGEKGQMYEGAIRVPMAIQWPGHLPSGSVYNEPVSSLDIMPTAAAVAGAHLPKSIDGVDLMPYLTGQRDDRPHTTFYWRQGVKTAVRVGDWKLVRMRQKQGEDVWELYDLAHDLSESNDLASKMPEKLSELKQIWQRLDDQMIEPAF